MSSKARLAAQECFRPNMNVLLSMHPLEEQLYKALLCALGAWQACGRHLGWGGARGSLMCLVLSTVSDWVPSYLAAAAAIAFLVCWLLIGIEVGRRVAQGVWHL